MTDNTTSIPNPLLQRVRIPGETFTLPSQGLFYKDGELDPSVTNGEVYIFPMVTIDEIVFKTPDKLYSGEAIVEVFNRCVPSVKKPLRLLAKDVDFIMVCLRKLTYGDSMEISYKHDCEEAKRQTYTISMSPFMQNTRRIDPTTLSKVFKITLPNDQVVMVEPPRFDSILKIYRSASESGISNLASKENDFELMRRDLTETFVGMISSVDDISDKNLISEWIQQLPAGWMRKISNLIEASGEWGPNFDTHITCKDCGKDATVSTPINPLAFFI